MSIDVNAMIQEAKEIKPEGGSRCGRTTYAMSCVNNHNGRRLSFTPGLYEKLGKPKKLQFLSLIQDEQNLLFVGEVLPNTSTSYTPSLTNNRAIIYHAGLVQQLTSDFELCYEKITSLTFNSVEFDEVDGYTVAIIKMPIAEPKADN